VATAFRAKSWVPFGVGGKVFDPTKATSRKEQESAEREVLARFYDVANAAGLPLPGDPATLVMLRSAFFRPGMNGDDEWPTPECVPLLAVAQHYGVPTRLLDWTRSPLAAAYFAADSASRREVDGKDYLDIWAVRESVLRRCLKRSGIGGARWDLAEVPESANENLHAQRGLFAVLRGEPRRARDGLQLDDYVGFLGSVHQQVPSAPQLTLPAMRRISLPAAMAPELLMALEARGISGASIFPGFSGVVRAMKERSFYLPDYPPEVSSA